MTGVLFCSLLCYEKTVNYILNMDIFLTKTHRFTTGGLYSPPELREALFIMDRCTLLNFFWTVEKKHPPTAIIKLGRARTFSDWIRLKKRKSYIPRMPLG